MLNPPNCPKAITSPLGSQDGIMQEILYAGQLEFQGSSGLTAIGNGEIVWRWIPSPEVCFKASVDQGPALFNDDEIIISTPSQTLPSTFISQTEGLNPTCISGPLSAYSGDASGEYKEMIFHVPNFVNYHGTLIYEQRAKGFETRAGRLTLETEEWNIQIDNQNETSNLIKRLHEDGTFGITHVGSLTKIDGSTFNFQGASELFDALGFFLSFVRGLWTQPCLIIGKGSNSADENHSTSYKHVHTSNVKLTPWRGVQSWFSQNLTNHLPDLFRKFWIVWQNQDSRVFLKEIIGSYLEINGQLSVQSKLVLGQIALEMIAYEVLTDADGNEPIGNATSKITALLDRCHITDAIPQQFAELRTAANDSRWKANPSDPTFNGPGICVAVRNSLVHSKRSKRIKRQALNINHYVQASMLTSWHLELAILSFLSYEGQYSCRWKNGYASDVEYVPWARSL